MAAALRDRVTIDLRGIGNAVREAAKSRGATLAVFARQALVDAMGPRAACRLTWRSDDMTHPNSLDGVLVQWGDRLFYPSNRMVRASAPYLTGASLHERAQSVRRRAEATVVRRAP